MKAIDVFEEIESISIRENLGEALKLIKGCPDKEVALDVFERVAEDSSSDLAAIVRLMSWMKDAEEIEPFPNVDQEFDVQDWNEEDCTFFGTCDFSDTMGDVRQYIFRVDGEEYHKNILENLIPVLLGYGDEQDYADEYRLAQKFLDSFKEKERTC